MTKKFKCHMCDMESKPNALMARHKNKHLSTDYTIDQYKKDLWAHNGIHPNICPVCNKETVIAKGDGPAYPKLHDECYKKHWKHGDTNPNWQGGLHTINCTECNREMKKHTSHLGHNGRKFCSQRCSISFYAKKENETPKLKIARHEASLRVKSHLFSDQANAKRKASMKKVMSSPEFVEGAATRMRERWKSPEYRKEQAGHLAKQTIGVSKLEKDVAKVAQTLYPDLITQEFIGFYTCDIFVPSSKLIIEVQGAYWHGRPERILVDKTKRSYFQNREYTVRYIHEHPWRECKGNIEKQLELLKKSVEGENEPLPPHLR
jgi:very-short-patch-repair endonuclease